jgi:DNA-binding HxlR family transcriptional regulator
MPEDHDKKISSDLGKARGAYERLEQVIGCKWSVSVLEAVRLGVSRPGALEKRIAGISTKVLSERLRRLTDTVCSTRSPLRRFLRAPSTH